MDSNEVFDNNEEEEKPMAKIRLDGRLEYEAAPEVVVAFEKLRNDNATLNTTIKDIQDKAAQDAAESKTKLDQVGAQRDTLQAEKAKLDEQLKAKDKEHADSLDKAVKQRVYLLSIAATHKVEKADEMTDRQIKEAVVKAVRGDDADFKDKSDEYINAAFDFCKGESRNDAMAQQRAAVAARKPGQDRKDEETSSASRRDAMIEKMKNVNKGGKK